MEKEITVWIAHCAEYIDQQGELVTFAKTFSSLEEAAKFIVEDYNDHCRSYDDDDTLSEEEWSTVAATKSLESPGDEAWPTWIEWEITEDTVKVTL